jgi:hypothetical protein
VSSPYPIKDRPLSTTEVEQMRLLLSTFRDGSGQVVRKPSGESMPGFRDFERVTAIVCHGTTPENKGIFDVLVPTAAGLPYGISCKMSIEQPSAHGSFFMELSNSAKKFHDEWRRLGIDWTKDPAAAGTATIDLVTSWHTFLDHEVDLTGSRYLVLAHDKAWRKFRLISLSLNLRLANPTSDIRWAVEGRKGPSTINGYIRGNGREHRLWQHFPNSGGQLKYYPPLEWAEWTSDTFELEQPVVITLQERVDRYFPGLWPTA